MDRTNPQHVGERSAQFVPEGIYRLDGTNFFNSIPDAFNFFDQQTSFNTIVMVTNQNKGTQGGSAEQSSKAGQQHSKNSGSGKQSEQSDSGRERQSEGGRKGGQK